MKTQWLFILSLIAQAVAVHAAQPTPATPATNALAWGEPVAGLQMGCVLDDTAGIIACTVRNCGDSDLLYDSMEVGYFESVNLSVRWEGAWKSLPRPHCSSRAWMGALNPICFFRRLTAHASLAGGCIEWAERRGLPPPTNNYPGVFPGYSRTSSPSYAGVEWRPGIPRPKPPFGSYPLDLLDFDWPTNMLGQASLQLRVSQKLECILNPTSNVVFTATDGLEAQMQAARIPRASVVTKHTFYSPTLILDARKIAALLEKCQDTSTNTAK